ncbi:MAG TPA: LytTR family DNA-binding domain-containing protein [Bacteroidales bacterium]|nr:LytTR family DNA-binding domain-containing protein [Bacteroidales bacterium]HPT02317.1 LytTR family DNA-binding domain-containing protein [Bacteroidales bacterium]
MNLRCIIVDDEPLALDLLEGYVVKTPWLILEGRFSSAFEAMAFLEKVKVDLVFLDIQMPGLSGLEFSRSLQNGPRVIFTTAFGQYALDGFKVEALDYLLKPVSYPEFLSAANKARRWFELTGKSAGQLARNTIFVKSDYKMVQIELSKILYIEGLKDYVKIYREDTEKPVLTLMSMKSLEENLPENIFMRVHRSFIVNLEKITTIERNRIVFGKTYIPVSDNYKDKFLKFVNERFF